MTIEIESAVTRRNFRLGVINGLFFFFAETLMDPTLVLVAFVSRLTGSALWLGLIVPLRDASWFLPQLWVSGYLQSWPRKLRLYQYMAVVRLVVWTGLVVAVFVMKPPDWLLLTFFIAYGIGSLAAGVSGLPFLEVVGKTIPAEQRGAFFAWRQTFGGLAAIAGSAVVGWLLGASSPLQFPNNFGALFVMGIALTACGLAAFANTIEPPDHAVRPSATVLDQLRRAVSFTRAHENYRRFIALRVALMIAGAATPFFAVYVQRQLGGSLGMVGTYLATYTVSSLLANVMFGRFSAQWGNRKTMVISAGAGLLMTITVLLLVLSASPLKLSGWAASLWLVPAFALSGVRESGLGVAGQSLLLDIAPRTERTLYLGFTNTLLGIVLLSTGGSGAVVETLGFLVLLLLAVAAHVFALNTAVKMRDVEHS